MKKKLLFIFILGSIGVFAQDPQFSQLYSVPLYMGPSFAGAAGNTRISANFRDQWPAVDREYISYSLSVDHFFDGTNTGIGGFIYRDHSGMGNLSTTNLSLLYSYSFNLNKSFSLRPGISFSLVNRHIDYSDIIFGDQLSLEGIKPTSIEPQLYEDKYYIDFGASILGLHKTFWLGATLDHLTTPDQSLTGTKSEIPIKLNIFGGVKYVIKKRNMRSYKKNIYVMFQYKKQEEFNQAFLGFYWENNNVITGIWYRGLPFQKTWDDYLNNDAIAFLIGYKWREYSIGYSYDFTTSQLSSNSAGAHEVTISWVRKKKRTKKAKKVIVPCPML